MKSIPLNIGCYTDSPSKSKGIYQVVLDLKTGTLSDLELAVACRNPSFVLSTNLGLYAISEVDQQSSPKLLHIPEALSSTKVNSKAISGDHPCHIAISSDRKYIITSQYSSGSFDIFSLKINGSIDKKLLTLSPSGKGPHPDRQTRSHAHQCVFLESESQFATVDLGADQICFYCFDEEQDEILNQPTQIINVPPGSGPRHLTFNDAETTCYVACELSETILVLSKEYGSWKQIQEIDSLQQAAKGEAVAAIKLSPDGKFLYVSNRHQSEISCFKICAQSHKLDFIGSYSTEGEFPRDFLITQDGNWLVAANQQSNNLTSFKIDRESGALCYTQSSLTLDAPVCISG
ncbi:lactonase family protein [Vibrio gallaecicus]|uniref:lactonase family protein n=1 Tax=Vibrio gallaecicus TaxID=552386 RepID=UPI0010C9E1BB|nr:lactonase family protein [Vibrio gallaecicus]MDN3614332.1 lactonase family protein [Vibrio gallaecicus]